MARNQRTYDNEYKAQAVKLAQEIGGAKAAKELGIPDGTIYCWVKAFKEGRLSASEASHTPKNALSEYSCVMKSHFRKFGNQSSGTRKSPILCLMTYPFLLGYLSRPCRICGA